MNRIDTKAILRKYDDLKVQAMMFDMDIDVETMSLVEKRKDEIPFWIKRWREKQLNSDYMQDGSDDQEYDKL